MPRRRVLEGRVLSSGEVQRFRILGPRRLGRCCSTWPASSRCHDLLSSWGAARCEIPLEVAGIAQVFPETKSGSVSRDVGGVVVQSLTAALVSATYQEGRRFEP